MELRVHGIGGPTAEGVLGCRQASVLSWRSEPRARSSVRHAAGDQATHVYHWSPLTSGSRAFALWPLLLPFTLLNLAGWMCPRRGRLRVAVHRAAVVLLGLCLTAATVVWLALAADTVWRKVTGSPLAGVRGRSWQYWAAAGSAAVVMGLVVLAATLMARGYDAFRPGDWAPRDARWRWPWGANLAKRLDDEHFYDNEAERRLAWSIHVAVTLGMLGLVVALGWLADDSPQAVRWLERAVVVLGAVQFGLVLVLAAVALPGGRRPGPSLRWRLAAPALALLAGMLTGGLVLSALVAFVGIEWLPAGPLGMVYDAYGWAVLAAIVAGAAVAVGGLLVPSPGEQGPRAGQLLPTVESRLRARLASTGPRLEWAVLAAAGTFLLAGGGLFASRWLDSDTRDSWRLSATPPVNVARATFGLVIAFVFLNLVKSRANPAALRRVGNIWDAITYWPRSYHPFAVRPYTERAVPELALFLRSGRRTEPFVVVAHSQGTAVLYAAIRPFLTDEARRDGRRLPPLRVVTCGSPLRSFYASAFPHYIDPTEIAETREHLGGRWTNVFRFTDHIGRALFRPDLDVAREPAAARDDIARERAAAGGDIAVADPGARLVVLGHNDYWTDPALREVVAASGRDGAIPEPVGPEEEAAMANRKLTVDGVGVAS